MIDQLKKDLQDVIARLPGGQLVPASDLRDYFANDLLPFITTMVTEIADMDDTIESIAQQSEDVLHADSAAVFAGLIVTGRALMAELKKRAAKEPALIAQVGAWNTLATQAENLLNDITLEEDDDEDTETVRDGDDDDDDDAEEEEASQ